MHPLKKLSLRQLTKEQSIYFNWSANALVPFHPGAADTYLIENFSIVKRVADLLLNFSNYVPEKIYRGVILKEPVSVLHPHKKLTYLSFSTEPSVAEHFAHPKGFGSEVINLQARLGSYGYVI